MKDFLIILGLCVLFAITAFLASIYSKHPEFRLLQTDRPTDLITQENNLPTLQAREFTCDDFTFSVNVPAEEMPLTTQAASGDGLKIKEHSWAGKYRDDVFGKISVDCIKAEKDPGAQNSIESVWNFSKFDVDLENNYELISEFIHGVDPAEYFIAKAKNPAIDYSEQYAYIYQVARIDQETDITYAIRLQYLSPLYNEDSVNVFNGLKGSLRYRE